MTDDIERRRRRAEEMRGAVERRSITSPLEIRSDNGRPTLRGKFTTFNDRYSMGSLDEQVAPTALDRCLREQPDVVFWADHGRSLSGLPLARTRSAKGGPGTLVLFTRDDGGYFDASLDPEDSDVQTLVRAIRNGNISACSMAFRCLRDTYSADGSLRTLEDISLHGGDVAAVAMPANPATSISVRAAELAAIRRPMVDHTKRARERLAQLRAGTPERTLRAAATVADVSTADYYRQRVDELRRGG